mmetsp:Transcript_31471/g.62393  ORF Transcript_31471/g.62393 Transcript_31471/m.62393 type:complete len:148 (+) Transcript_31471:213-656(+)
MDGFGGRDLDTIDDQEERISEINKRLAYLQWRRSTVENSIRKIVDVNKRQAEHDTLMQISEARGLAKQKWTQEIVADELCKPLELSKKFVQDFHEQEKREQETERKTVENHLKSLNKLKERVLSSPQGQSNPEIMARISNLERHLAA